jgi:hypothetical protein
MKTDDINENAHWFCQDILCTNVRMPFAECGFHYVIKSYDSFAFIRRWMTKSRDTALQYPLIRLGIFNKSRKGLPARPLNPMRWWLYINFRQNPESITILIVVLFLNQTVPIYYSVLGADEDMAAIRYKALITGLKILVCCVTGCASWETRRECCEPTHCSCQGKDGEQLAQ